MDSIPRKRPKSETRTPKRNPKSSSSPIRSMLEPPQSFFPSKEEFFRLLKVLLVACAVAFTCNFLAKSLSSNPTKSFCDSNFDSIDSDLDFCEPCPINGECYQGKLKCNLGYKKQRNLCVEDGEINESTKKLVGYFERKVCEAYAHNECYGTGAIWVPENDVWKELRSNSFLNNFDESAYNFLKGKAVEGVTELLEKRTNSNGIDELKCPESVARSYKPLTCRMRQWLLRHILIISSACAMLVGSAILRRKIQRKRYFSKRVEELYDQVCDFLEENAVASNSADTSNCEPWVIASWLRDYLLLPRERRDPLLWLKVEELIKEDSRIDQCPKVVKGEQKVVYEWQVEGSLSLSKLKKQRETQKKVGKSIGSSTSLQENYNRRIAETSS
ncbi:Man1/Src1 C-terminal [Arabidopsis suecica]|uniref:Man1/Src1 C-terminal n=1 Tax=Arabidopsis suecica TaxID=45249 RepID=A0A8T1XP90_ARASU|nr:Man1/Src1 C-terminal [Arabidopsis suecica]